MLVAGWRWDGVKGDQCDDDDETVESWRFWSKFEKVFLNVNAYSTLYYLSRQTFKNLQ